MIFVPGGPVSHLLFICIFGLNHQTPGASTQTQPQKSSLDRAKWALREGLWDHPQLKTTGLRSSAELWADASLFATASVILAISECQRQSWVSDMVCKRESHPELTVSLIRSTPSEICRNGAERPDESGFTCRILELSLSKTHFCSDCKERMCWQLCLHAVWP